MAKTPQVRLACAKDTTDLIRLVSEAHAEEALGPVKSLDEGRVFEAILQALRGEAIIAVIGDAGEIQSACHLAVARPWYSSTGILQSLWFWTRPDYRKSSNSKVLLNWASHQAARLNSPLQMECSLSEIAQPKFELFKRVLGDPAGYSWAYKPNPDAPTGSEANIEPASVADENEVIGVARELAKENGLYSTDEDLAVPMLKDAIAGNGCIGLIRGAEAPREIEATIFLRISKSFYSSEPFLDEFFAYVKPEFRKTPNAKSLLSFAKRQSDRLNIPLRVGIISRVELSRKRALYQRFLGSAPSVACFTYHAKA